MISPAEYFDEYTEELTDNERLKLWLEHMETFTLLLRVCPFPISKEAEEWINCALLDI